MNKAEGGGAELHRPNSFLLQWHITERCNLRCAHCYQDAYKGQELTYEQLLQVLEQYKDLLGTWRAVSKKPVGGHITVTGGEPFSRKDFLDLLEVFAAHRGNFSYSVLSNGTFIDAAMAKRLKDLRPRSVQVSVEGSRETHDSIRGEGNYEKTVAAIEHLVGTGVRTLISFTAHRRNYKEVTEVVRMGRRLGVARVWSDRLIPRGSGLEMKEQMLTPEETREFFKIMKRARAEAGPFGIFSKTKVGLKRALQFLVATAMPYRCIAGDAMITVQPNGDLYPCRRMPVKVGNLMETPLNELYYSSEFFQELRDRSRLNDHCRGCTYGKMCRGGLKCLTYAVTGDPHRTDPGCWLE